MLEPLKSYKYATQLVNKKSDKMFYPKVQMNLYLVSIMASVCRLFYAGGYVASSLEFAAERMRASRNLFFKQCTFQIQGRLIHYHKSISKYFLSLLHRYEIHCGNRTSFWQWSQN